MTSTASILIVEDELLIADLLSRYVRKDGYGVTGTAATFSAATQLYLQNPPDLVLLDLRLKGERNGLDFAAWINRQPKPAPFICLTSQSDPETVQSTAALGPAGYLTKPVRPQDLLATITLALAGRPASLQGRSAPANDAIEVVIEQQKRSIPAENILLLEAEHVYVKIHLQSGTVHTVRGSLVALERQLPPAAFLKVHRSFVVNQKRIDKWSTQFVEVGGRKIPISRSRRDEVLSKLAR